MTNIEKVLEFLSQNRNSFYCDDCIREKTGIEPRQQVNSICRSLASQAMILRKGGVCFSCSKGRLVNQIHGSVPEIIEKQNHVPLKPELETVGKPWYWEGNLQLRLVSWLVGKGYKISRVADTASRFRGVDIIAHDAQGGTLWINVKGYPETSRHVQARHYFASAIFDLIVYRGESATVQLGIGLPAGFTTCEFP